MPLELRGLQAWITCDDDELPQYQVEQEGDKSITCCIPSKAGKAFVIRYKSNGFDQSDISIDVFVDGKQAISKVSCSLKRLRRRSRAVKGFIEGSTVYPFVFAAVRTTEEDVSSNGDLSQLGLVEIKFFRVKKIGACEADDSDPATDSPFSSEIDVPERSKLAGYHCTVLGEPIQSKALRSFYITEIDAADDPFCIFRFQHMPRDMLQARGIIPRPTSSEPARDNPSIQKKRKKQQEEKSSKRSRPSGSSSSAAFTTSVKPEVSEESDAGRSNASDSARIRALEAELEELKRRRAATPQCKLERPPSPIHVGSFDGQTIDLTSD